MIETLFDGERNNSQLVWDYVKKSHTIVEIIEIVGKSDVTEEKHRKIRQDNMV